MMKRRMGGWCWLVPVLLVVPLVLAAVRVEAAPARAPGARVPARLAVGAPVNVSQRDGNQSEATIAVNPANPQQLAVFSNDTADVPGLFAAISGDGGLTWEGRSIFGSGSTAACCDAQATFDRFGNLFLTYLGRDHNVYLAASFDGGQTFGVLLTLTGTGDADQPSLATGPGGTAASSSVWVSYFNGEGVAARFVPVAGLGALGTLSPEQVAPSSLGAYGDVEVGPQGQVLITYQREGPAGAGPSQIVVHLDADGPGPALFGAGIVVAETQVGTARIIPTTSNSLGVDAEANLAWDRSGGPFSGRVYLVYTDAPSVASDDLDIYVRYSDTGGQTWSAARRINDDASGNSQFLPAIAVDQTSGRVGIDWYDGRASADNREAQLYAAVSLPGGQVWEANAKVAPALSSAAAADAGVSPFRPLGYGDYITADFHDQTFYAVWPDNSAALANNPALPKLDLAVAKVRALPGAVYQRIFPLVVKPDRGDSVPYSRIQKSRVGSQNIYRVAKPYSCFNFAQYFCSWL